MTDRPHGYARYRLDGCRCYICGYARAQYDDNRTRTIAYGTWHPWTDATPIRAHIQTLQSCGMGLRRIADIAGCDRKRLQAILTGRPERNTGPQQRVRPELAATILAIEPTLNNLGAATVITATGTTQRLQALITAGWPKSHLAKALGTSPGNFGVTMAGPHVTVRTARLVHNLYEQLWNTNPADHSATPGGITRARQYAAAHQWAPPAAWDDDTIDDPTAYPD